MCLLCQFLYNILPNKSFKHLRGRWRYVKSYKTCFETSIWKKSLTRSAKPRPKQCWLYGVLVSCSTVSVNTHFLLPSAFSASLKRNIIGAKPDVGWLHPTSRLSANCPSYVWNGHLLSEVMECSTSHPSAGYAIPWPGKYCRVELEVGCLPQVCVHPLSSINTFDNTLLCCLSLTFLLQVIGLYQYVPQASIY